jgi:ribose-phosphate pyrophosphokinase
MQSSLSIISGRSNPLLASVAAKTAGVSLTTCDVHTHSDGELFIEIGENVRGNDVFIVQSTCPPVNDHLMELLIIIDALKRASAERITAVVPYFGYARQDRKNKPRQPISAKLVADLLTAAGADRILTMDLHAGQIMGFFNLPVDNLFARPVFLRKLNEVRDSDGQICIVSPDSGGVSRARAYAKRLDAPLAIIDKRRSAPNEVAEMNVVGDVKGMTAIIIDDMVDTAGTLVKGCDALLAHGAKGVYACCTHAVLSGKALDNLSGSKLKKLFTSDTIHHDNISQRCPVVEQLSVAGLLGEAIRRIHEESSVSSLFESDI